MMGMPVQPKRRQKSARTDAIDLAEITRLRSQERDLRDNSKSLELRLAGCLRTIKTLQKENQAKTEQMSLMKDELRKKTRQIELLTH